MAVKIKCNPSILYKRIRVNLLFLISAILRTFYVRLCMSKHATAWVIYVLGV